MKKLNVSQLETLKGGTALFGCNKYVRRYLRVADRKMATEYKEDLLDALLEAYDECIKEKYS